MVHSPLTRVWRFSISEIKDIFQDLNAGKTVELELCIICQDLI